MRNAFLVAGLCAGIYLLVQFLVWQQGKRFANEVEQYAAEVANGVS